MPSITLPKSIAAVAQPIQGQPVIKLKPYQSQAWAMEWYKILVRIRDEANYADVFIPCPPALQVETFRQLISNVREFVNNREVYDPMKHVAAIALYGSESLNGLLEISAEIEVCRAKDGVKLRHTPALIAKSVVQKKDIASAMQFGSDENNNGLRKRIIDWIKLSRPEEKFLEEGLSLTPEDIQYVERILKINNGVLVGRVEPTMVLLIRE